jgi:hypothetical protein
MGGHRGHDCMVVFYGSDLQLPMQSVPITTNVVSSNSAHGVVYSIQHYVIKFDNDLRQVDGFHRVLWFLILSCNDTGDYERFPPFWMERC